MQPLRLATISGLSLLAACSLTRETPALEDTPCEIVLGVDPCGDTLACTYIAADLMNRCRPVEVCDLMDNDRDGEIDENLDADGDGVLPCAPTPDCDDGDNTRYPGNTEVCDLVDHDCDGRPFPEDAAAADALCSDGQLCELSGCVTADCRSDRLRCGDNELCENTSPGVWECNVAPCVDCTAGEYCSTDGCQAIVGLGQPCTVNEGCSTGSCAAAESFVATSGSFAQSAASYCVEPCCTDEQCGAGEFCWTHATGLSTCWPVGLEQDATGRSSLGVALGAESCDADSDCRSGLCDTNAKRCVSACRRDTDCGGFGVVCGLTSSSLGATCIDDSDYADGGSYCGLVTIVGEDISRECGFDCPSVGFSLGTILYCDTGCADNSDCDDGSCQLSAYDGRYGTVCASVSTVETCCSDDQCSSGQCVVRQISGRALMYCDD